MLTSISRLAVVLVFLTQAPAPLPIKLGDVGKSLTDSDVVEITRIASPTGPAPWLIDGFHGGSIAMDTINAYLPPDSTTKDVRRGKAVTFFRPTTTGRLPALSGTEHYAQVSVAGREFKDVQSDMDIGRPFQVFGIAIDDDELVRLVTFIRTKAGSLPIQWIDRTGTDAVTVRLVRSAPRTQVTNVNGLILGIVDLGDDNILLLGRSGNEWKVLRTFDAVE